MSRSENVILTNMCLIEDGQGNIVMQIRDSDRYDWSGAVLTGGHIENFESLYASVVREVYEETGLTIFHPRLVGMKHFHLRKTGQRYLVFLYKVTEYQGKLRDSEEGKVVWISRKDLEKGRIELAESMTETLQVFESKDISELFYERDESDDLQQYYF
ncbi:8-oxo-dGTP diphosphatase [Streptococcus henryi]|uniref:8-oxo-dGTP diphosphatase n=1 Tax=Streptococcus henryi TaxID=439219 RepID=UPI0003717102|nr:NUDIX domain-containing protein [Streptococcus henryi]